MDKRLWHKLEPFFCDYKFVHIDIPIESSIEKIVEKIAFDIEDENINLLGFSLGGYLASYLAIKYPKKVKQLLLISSSTTNLSEKEIKERELGLNIVEKFGFKSLSKKKILSLIEDTDNSELIKLISDMYKDSGKENFFNQIKATTLREDITDELLSLNIEKTILYGSEDSFISTQYIKDLEEKNNNKLKKIETKSHVLPLEYPKETASYIMKWLEN